MIFIFLDISDRNVHYLIFIFSKISDRNDLCDLYPPSRKNGLSKIDHLEIFCEWFSIWIKLCMWVKRISYQLGLVHVPLVHQRSFICRNHLEEERRISHYSFNYHHQIHYHDAANNGQRPLLTFWSLPSLSLVRLPISCCKALMFLPRVSFSARAFLLISLICSRFWLSLRRSW